MVSLFRFNKYLCRFNIPKDNEETYDHSIPEQY